MHFFIFWGFTILAIQVVHMFARGFFPDFHLPLLSADLLGGPYLLLKDLIQVVVLGAIGMALYRWVVSHPPRLFGFAPAEERLRGQSHWEALLILGFIGTHHDRRVPVRRRPPVYAGARRRRSQRETRLAAASAPWSAWRCSPSAAPALAEFASNFGWWLHNCVILVFMNLLPLSKHFHIITSVPNVFFKKLEPTGALSKQDLENATTFGTSYINQFTWKQVLDMYSCTECGRCSSHCPATISGKELAPRQLLLNLRDYLYEHERRGPGAHGRRRRRRGEAPRTSARTSSASGSSTTTCCGRARPAAPARRPARC